MKKFLLLSAAMASLAINAKAVVVLAVDINTSTSPGYSGNFTDPVDSTTGAFTSWNVTGTTNTTKSFTGLSTQFTDTGSITLTFNKNFSGVNDRNTTLTNTAGTYQAIYRDHILTASNTTLTISGLKANTVYGITFQAYESNAARNSIFTPVTSGVTNPSAQTASGALTPVPGNSLFASNASVSFNSLTGSALTSSSTGTIVFNLSGSTTAGTLGETRINGFQIYATAIPEPSSFAALAGGAFLMLAVARRRRS